jgi:MoaA/NifB/PqqE/SkfB family radical SAM enzyme
VRRPFVLVPQHFGSTVFERRRARYLPFDHEATALLRAAKAAPMDHLADAASEPHRSAILRFFEHFERLGLFDLERRFVGEVLDLAPPEGHLVGPLAVHLEVSAACNLACVHCFAGALPRREEALSLAELDALFADLAAIGSFRLGLTGGEPLLRRDLLSILDLAVEHGLSPCLTTNGLLLDEALAAALGRRDLAWINVSLDGATAETHDAIRGAGTFARTCEKIRLLARHAPFTVALTLHKRSAVEIRAAARLAIDLGASTLVVRPLYPVGAAAARPDLMPTFEEYSAALADLCALGHEVRGVEPWSPATRESSTATVHDPDCGAGTRVCSISLGGDVSPCSFLGPAFVAGNIRERPFPAIWRDAALLGRLRAAPSEGCRARSLALAGDAGAPDPWLPPHRSLPVLAKEETA